MRPLAPLMAAVLAVAMPTAHAAPMASLYVVIVPGSNPTQAAQEAMRVELVKLTGVRAAASDPAFAGLIDNAAQYVQGQRATTTGQIQFLFNEPALAAAVAAAGRSIWDPHRPLLWVVLPPQDAATAQALRMRLAAAADARGLPITIVTAGAAAAAPEPVNIAQMLDTALRAGASAALVAQALPSDPTVLQWTLAAPTTGGQWTGAPELAIDQATDALANATRTLDQAPVAQYECHISGVTDLASLVNVLSAVQSSPGVSQVAVGDVQGDELTLHLTARGSGAELEHVLASGRLQPTGPGTGGELQYRYVAGP
ncbi:MAG: DUF2066 domain-containing protein [Steroidobacteraceae bacterium]